MKASETKRNTAARYRLARLLKRFERKWVALAPDYTRVLSSGDTLQEVEAKLSQKRRAEAIYFKVPPAHAYFVPAIL